MPIVQAASVASPDPGQPGTGAVNFEVVVGHATTTCSVSVGPEDSDSVVKSCQWFDFVGSTASAVNLQFNWAIGGAGLTLSGANIGITTASASFTVEYSTDNGSNWTTALTRTFSRDSNGNTAISDSGSVNVSLAVVPVRQIAVRDTISAAAASAGDPAVLSEAEITAIISEIQLSVVAAAVPPVMFVS